MKRGTAVAGVIAVLTLVLAVWTGAALAGAGHGDEHGGRHASEASTPAEHHDARSESGAGSHESRHEVAHASKHESAHASKRESRHAAKHVASTHEQKTHYGPHEKVYVCHATGSATNPYVLIHVSKNALKAHTSHQDGRDVVLGDSAGGGCPAPRTAQVQARTEEHRVRAKTEERHERPHSQKQEEEKRTETVQVEAAQECSRTATVAVPVGVKHFVGPKGSGRYVIIHPSPSSAHYENKHPDEIVYETRTVAVRVDCEASEQQVKAEARKQAVAAVETTATTTTAAVPAAETVTVTVANTETQAVAATTTSETQTVAAAAAVRTSGTTTTSAPSAGGVLGAQATLASPPAKHGGGVLGTVGSATLPFTGLPLWAVVLAALGVAGLGLAVRRGLRESF